MKPDFQLTAGNRPMITAALTDDLGNPVDLTGATVQFVFQSGPLVFTQAAAITNPPGVDGNVNYQMQAGDTSKPGRYQAQWVATVGGVPLTFPTGSLNNDDDNGRYIVFDIVPALPLVVGPANIVLIAQMFEPVRVCLGDFNQQFRKYENDAITSVVRTCLMTGKVPGQSLGSDLVSIVPGIINPNDLALLMYHAAKMFIAPKVAEWRIDTRAMSQREGRKDHFFFELTNAIYEIENGEMFSCFQSFYAWVNSLTGIDIWSVLSDMKTAAPVATVNIGRAGVTVSTT